MTQKDQERLEIFKNILIKLHQGADPKSVQEEFNQHFTGVSAIEISMMEHQLMNSHTGITFEDVMQLCNVHANLFKGAINEQSIADADLPGHPVRVFKDENIAFQAALIRIHRLFDKLKELPVKEWETGLLNGLKRQMTLLGQFKNHYARKEEVIFPIMERLGHTSPPKVMWGVDDQIRELYDQALASISALPDLPLNEVLLDFSAFEDEFKEMVFKEEAILLQILLEIFTEDDWIKVAEDSDIYGYGIIRPSERWQPQREDLTVIEDIQEDQEEEVKRILDVKDPIDQAIKVKFDGGYLTLKEIDRILDHLQIEITFVSKDNIFSYFNQQIGHERKILPRSQTAIGRHVEKCHPPKVVDKVKRVIENLRTKRTESETMWFSRNGFFALIIYRGVYDENGDFMGVLETVQNIEPLFDLKDQADSRRVSTDQEDGIQEPERKKYNEI